MTTTLQVIQGVLTILVLVLTLPIWKWIFAARDAAKDVEALKVDMEKFKQEARSKIEKLNSDHGEHMEKINSEHRSFEKVLAEFSVAVAELRKTCEYINNTMQHTLTGVQEAAAVQQQKFVDIIDRLLDGNNK